MRTIAILVLATLVVSGCSGGNTGALPVGPTADLSADKLQFAIGTVNDPNNTLMVNGSLLNTSLNFVETFRQANGTTALLSDVVTVTGPPSLIVGAAPQYDGGASNEIVSVLSSVYAYGEGLDASGPAQYRGGLPIGNPLTPPIRPNFGSLDGPPAFPRTNDGTYPVGFAFGAKDITDLQFNGMAPTGSYTMTVTTPPGSSQSATWNATANLATLTLLPPISQPSLILDGKGGGAISFVVPQALTEAFVTFSYLGNYCYPGATDANIIPAGQYTFFLPSPQPGPMTIAVPDNLGPPIDASANSPTLCSAAQNAAASSTSGVPPNRGGGSALAQIVGVDYPLYELSYPQSRSQSPAIAGTRDPDGNPNAQADATISLMSNMVKAP